jgi:hypothetical protein
MSCDELAEFGFRYAGLQDLTMGANEAVDPDRITQNLHLLDDS